VRIAERINYRKKYNDDIYFKDMSDTIKRRGPDQDGKYISDYVTLVHTRLSVVDIENGRQPMINSVNGRDFCVVYNGELYNTEDIRSMLKAKGHSFIGHSDTEVLLKSYIEWVKNA
jgi:asparagine synthase (glutamine-hydrolysing)